MRPFFICSALIGSLFCGPFAGAETTRESAVESLSDLRWDHRIILLQGDKQGTVWRDRLQAVDADIRERHILWFLFSGDNRIQSNLSSRLPGHTLSKNFADQIREQYLSGGDRVILIGKDGFTKERSRQLDLDDIFAAIDVMPMRQAEMGGYE